MSACNNATMGVSLGGYGTHIIGNILNVNNNGVEYLSQFLIIRLHLFIMRMVIKA